MPVDTVWQPLRYAPAVLRKQWWERPPAPKPPAPKPSAPKPPAPKAVRATNPANHISNALVLLANFSLDSTGAGAALQSPWASDAWRRLPVVDVGMLHATDFTIPASTLGHRVYSFEPTPSSYAKATQALSERGIPWTEQADGFQHAAPGTVLALNAAASNESGSIVLSMACFRPWKSDGSCDEKGGGYANSLHGGAIPAFYKRREVRVKQLTLSDVLAHEPAGVYMLKIDAQGHEHHVLQGARRYLSKSPIHMILLEFSPKLLRAAGSDPVALLRLLQHTCVGCPREAPHPPRSHGATPACAYDILGHASRARGRLRYQCFETRNRAAVGAPAPALSLGPGARATLEEFVRAYEVDRRGFGMWTDLLCVNLATMRR